MVIFVVAISVVIYQVRRRERLRRKEEVRIQSREEVGNTDLEGGERTDDSDSDYTDIDDEEPKVSLICSNLDTMPIISSVEKRFVIVEIKGYAVKETFVDIG